MISFIKKLFTIPNTPYALPMRFHAEKGGYTWEDWHAEMKVKHPIRYFMSKTLTRFLRVNWRIYVSDPIYWIQSYVIRKDHLLDLRNGNINNEYGKYKWGYTDPCHLIELAVYKAFEKYVEECNLNYGGIDQRIKNLEENLKELQNSDNEYKDQYSIEKDLEHFNKVKEIYYFFNVVAPDLYEKEYKMLRDVNISINFSKDYDELYKFQEYVKTTTEEYLIEIIRQRHYMWT